MSPRSGWQPIQQFEEPAASRVRGAQRDDIRDVLVPAADGRQSAADLLDQIDGSRVALGPRATQLLFDLTAKDRETRVGIDRESTSSEQLPGPLATAELLRGLPCRLDLALGDQDLDQCRPVWFARPLRHRGRN